MIAIGPPRLISVLVEGWSMYPAYADGDRLLAKRRRDARRSRRRSRVSTGSVVVVPRPDEQAGWQPKSTPRLQPQPHSGAANHLVKRVAASPGDLIPPDFLAVVGAQPGDRVPPGVLLLLGDHPLSRDSKQHGYCPADLVQAVVIRKLGGSGRAGSVPVSVTVVPVVPVPIAPGSVPSCVLAPLAAPDLPQQRSGLRGQRVVE